MFAIRFLRVAVHCHVPCVCHCFMLTTVPLSGARASSQGLIFNFFCMASLTVIFPRACAGLFHMRLQWALVDSDKRRESDKWHDRSQLYSYRILRAANRQLHHEPHVLHAHGHRVQLYVQGGA